MKGECLNCGKKIADNISFCGYECKQEYKGKQEKTEFFKMELNLLKESVGKRVELGLSRGSNVKGTVTAFDDRFGKIAVNVKENNQTKTVVVRLGYVISFAIYD